MAVRSGSGLGSWMGTLLLLIWVVRMTGLPLGLLLIVMIMAISAGLSLVLILSVFPCHLQGVRTMAWTEQREYQTLMQLQIQDDVLGWLAKCDGCKEMKLLDR